MSKKIFMMGMVCVVLVFTGSVFAQKGKLAITGTDWEPYNGNKLLNKGFFTEITVTALKRVGYEVEVSLVPWKRAYSWAKIGEQDGLMGASYTEERTEFFAYPQYSWENVMHFFANTGENRTYKKLEDLCPARLGILRGSFYVDRFKPITCLRQDLANSMIINIKKLMGNRVDLIIDSKDSILYILNKEFPDKANSIEPVYPPFEKDKIYTVFSKKNPNYKQIVTDFDNGIQLIKKDGTYKKILKKHKIE
ncbi:transporter substrate-binding domain-containing protein [bacterium]|nr:transporter substrate-binding domain-containing protein [bacterium]